MACLIFAAWLAARSLSELLDGWSPQRFLAERMITIVTYFRSQVVKFIFGGRNSGQTETKAGTNNFCSATFANESSADSKPRICSEATQAKALMCLVFGSWVTTSPETARMQLCPSNWIRSAEIGCKFDLARFGPKPGDDIPNRTSPLELRHQ